MRHKYRLVDAFKRWWFDGHEGMPSVKQIKRIYPCSRCGLSSNARWHR